MSPQQVEADWYDYPQYFDLSFRDETDDEVEFFEKAFARYVDYPVRRVLETGCGGGRLVLEMARRNYDVVAFDLNEKSVSYVRRRLRRTGRSANVYVQDMTNFELEEPVDAAFCTWNTFRHLLTDESAQQHLRSVATAVNSGGIYILGLHLLPLDIDEECTERWTAKHGGTKVTATLKVIETRRADRIERLRINLRVRSGKRDLRIRHEFPLRMYTCQQMQELLASVPEWELVDVFDFWYDVDDPLELNDEITDTVLVLRKRREIVRRRK
ncbi:MAG TPA: class I SAM-dependent methyltransferase [Planctomycetes bacterium]|nr:class I SAM-dependent methyltransferase [Planctomycetota bacterium]